MKGGVGNSRPAARRGGCVRGCWEEEEEAYFCLLLAIFLVELVAGVLAHVYYQRLSEELKQHLTRTLAENYRQPGAAEITASVDRLQQDVSTCTVPMWEACQAQGGPVGQQRNLRNQAEGNSTDSREQHGGCGESRGTVLVCHLHRSLSPSGFSFAPRNMGMTRCCGSNSSADWQHSTYILSPEAEGRRVPDSCCKTVVARCGQRAHPSNIYKVEGGCITKLEQFLANHLLLMGAVGIGVACLQRPAGLCSRPRECHRATAGSPSLAHFLHPFRCGGRAPGSSAPCRLALELPPSLEEGLKPGQPPRLPSSTRHPAPSPDPPSLALRRPQAQEIQGQEVMPPCPQEQGEVLPGVRGPPW
ncbi:hypothetical protein J1605_020945 [Eschrichtius robustus]|uniref:Tetraspanin-11 n=1 Tax=Eschrichtius robustus TaxID=9764 RepID=A0AB34HIN4_ESCRO|nr:hypothetical protein J1605_020945 [Eschrichtius robustus]